MQDNPRICICGGGNIAHSLAVAFSATTNVSVLTRRPMEWESHLRCVRDPLCEKLESKYGILATDDIDVLSKVDCIIVALPRFAIPSVVNKIKDVLHSGQTLVFIPAPAGVEVLVEEFSARGIDLIGFQRTPYVSRIIEYGKAVWVSDVRSEHKLAFSRAEIVDRWSAFFASRLGGDIKLLSSFWSFTFSNSNPLLHPSRLLPLLAGGDGGRYDNCPYFYSEWTDESSELYVESDKEMYKAFMAYAPEAATQDYESALVHYEVKSFKELTKKIRNIRSLQKIQAPWVKDNSGGWTPDLNSRYFTEDIPFGTKVIQEYARRVRICTPTIDFLVYKIEEWQENAVSNVKVCK